MNRSEHRRSVLPVRVLPFLLVVGMPTDRNRGLGHVPGSPWNLSIRPTRSPPPAYRLTASSLPSALPFRCLEYHCSFAYLLASSILYRVSSPFLFPLHKYPFNFFTISPFSSFYFCPFFSFTFRFFCFYPFSSYRSADLISHIFQGFFFFTHRRSFFRLARKKSRRS